jgi:glycosyltransferase involved in cell wall biosynthesis
MLHSPKFSVIIPLYDDRGSGVRAIKSWLKQRTATDPFELIVVDAGRQRLVKQIRPLLACNDRIIECDSTNEATLYNAGAHAASSEWLLFTESHVIPENDCVANLLCKLSAPRFDAATLGTAHYVRSSFSDIDSRLFQLEHPTVQKLGWWRCIGLRGFLIRNSTFQALGCLNENYYRFSETVLAMQTEAAGYRIAELADVVLAHVDTDNIAELARAMYLGRVGICRFWEDSGILASRFFGGSMADHCVHWSEPQLIRLAFQEARRLWRNGEYSAAIDYFNQLIPELPAAIFGMRGHLAVGVLKTIWNSISFRLRLLFYRRNLPQDQVEGILPKYQALRESLARIGSLAYFTYEHTASGPIDVMTEQPVVIRYNAENLSESAVGFYECEVWNGHTYRWTRPTASLRLPCPPGNYELAFDIRPTGEWSVRKPRFFVEGVELDSKEIREIDGRIRIQFECGRHPMITWTCVPFQPRQAGLADRRDLGVAIISIEAHSRSGAATSWSRAA